MPARIEKSSKSPSSWIRVSGSMPISRRQIQQRLGPNADIRIPQQSHRLVGNLPVARAR